MLCSVAIAFKKVPFVIAFAPAFIDFIGGNMMLSEKRFEDQKQRRTSCTTTLEPC